MTQDLTTLLRRKQAQDYLDRISREAIAEYFRNQFEHPGRTYYLYYEAAQGDSRGRITIASEKPGRSWRRACRQPISTGWTQHQGFEFVRKQLDRLPMLPEEAAA